MAIIPNDQKINVFFSKFTQQYIDDLEGLNINNCPRPLKYYRVINNEIVKKSDLEIQEIKKYKRVLTEEERKLKSLEPSIKEVKEAEIDIKMINLIEEAKLQ